MRRIQIHAWKTVETKAERLGHRLRPAVGADHYHHARRRRCDLVNQRFAASLRGLARQYEALGSIDEHLMRHHAREMAHEMLDALGSYKLTAALLTFCQGPLQHEFVRRYDADIRADGERMILRMYDDPSTRKQAVGMACQTGRIITLDAESTHWVFKEAANPLELVQWANREGVSMVEMATELNLRDVKGVTARIAAAVKRHAERTGDSTGEEEASGHYL
jgi:hypothetical protein